MFRRHYNLILAAVWLLIAVLLLAPEELIAPQLAKQLGGPLKFPAGVLALVLAVYNVARWWAYQSLYRNRRAAVRGNPLAVREEGEKYEYNPELDFFKPADGEPPTPPGPSANGDHPQAHP